jgi:DNA-binding NarL/FixJ family response regulator
VELGIEGGVFMDSWKRPDIPDVKLTPRERDVLDLYKEGMFDQQIARSLGMAASTVRTHIASICSKLGSNHRFRCGILAERIGLTRSDRDG